MRPRSTPVLVDTLLAAMLTALSVTTVVEDRTISWVGMVLAAFTVVPIALRQVAPMLTLAVIALALTAYVLLGHGDDVPSGALGLVVAMFSVATLRRRVVAATAYVVTLAVFATVWLASEDVTWVMVVQAALVSLCAWALGAATRGWARDSEQAAAEAARSVAEERTRIARELHDVVAHHMSVVALQTGLAEFVLDSDPPAARAAVSNAAASGREALQDLGRMLHALRTETDDGATYAPQPGLRQLDDLVAGLRRAGLAVEVTRTGRERVLTPGLELCAYRIVQESLTNSLRHTAAGTHAAITVDYGDRVMTVSVADDGSPTAPEPSRPLGSGLGLRGMRERAELYGGVLEAGPGHEGGFVVKLRLPIAEPVVSSDQPALLAVEPESR